MKRCGGCKIRKDYSEFYNTGSSPDGYSWSCKRCHSLYAKTARIGNYGITKEQFENLLTKQDNRCAICQRFFDSDNLPVIDHDHACCPTKVNSDRLISRCGNCVRGLLCRSCNVGLGMFSDNTDRLTSAINYLKKSVYLDEYLLDIISLDVTEVEIMG